MYSKECTDSPDSDLLRRGVVTVHVDLKILKKTYILYTYVHALHWRMAARQNKTERFMVEELRREREASSLS